MHNISRLIPFQVSTVKFHHADSNGNVVCYPEILDDAVVNVTEQTVIVNQVTGPRLFGNWNGYVYQRSKPFSIERNDLQPCALSFSFEESYGAPSPCGRTLHSSYAHPVNLLAGGNVTLDKVFLLNPFYHETTVTRAKQACLDRASEVAGNLAISLAEAGKSWTMIINTARTVAKAVRQVRRRDLAAAWRTLSPQTPFDPKRFRAAMRGQQLKPGHSTRRSWENDWLALQYGWKPLLKDAYDAASVVAQRFTSHPKVFEASGSARQDGTSVVGGAKGVSYFPFWASTDVPGFTGRASYKANVYRDTAYRARAGLTLAVSSPALVNINQTVGNPMSLVWELLPGSFLGDWLFSIGDYLRNMTALNGITVLDGWVSTEQRFKDQGTCYSTGSGAGNWELTTPGYFYSERVLYSRTNWSGDVSFSLATTAVNGARWQQLATVSALIAQVFKR